MRKSKVKRSTNLFYEYLTADVYSWKGCFTIAIIHRPPHTAIVPLVERLLERIEKVLSPKIVVFDGEFSSVNILRLLQRKNIKFLARKSRVHRVKEHLSKYYKNPDWESERRWRSLELLSKRHGIRAINVDICPQNVKGEMKTLIKSSKCNIY